MKESKTAENDRKGGQPARRTPPIVTSDAWEAARQEMLVKEKGLMRARDALAAERRRNAMDGRREGVRIRRAERQS